MISSFLSIRLSLLVAAALALVVVASALVVGTSADRSADAAASVTASATVATATVATTAATPAVELVSAKKNKKSSAIAFTPEKVLKVAKRYAGTRYSYGGDSPSGFDCSGFTKFIYAKFGVDLPHSAWKQSREGHRVSRAKAKPGDLVITAGGAHVGIWVSKGKFIDAGFPGQGVHVREIYTDNYYVVRVESDTQEA